MLNKRAALFLSTAVMLLLTFSASCQTTQRVTGHNSTSDQSPVTSQTTEVTTSTEETFVDSAVEYVEPLRSLDQALETTELVVDATVETVEEFTPGTMQYRLKVDTCHYGRVDEESEIFMYHHGAPLDAGQQYLLFLSLEDVTLYPHPIAAATYDILFESSTDTLVHMDVRLAESREDLFAKLKTKEGYDKVYQISQSKKFASVDDAWQNSDQFSLVTIRSEEKVNRYASIYHVIFKDGWSSKGTAKRSSLGPLLLPPGLEPGKDYYLALEQDEDGNLFLAGLEYTIIESDHEDSARLMELIQ